MHKGHTGELGIDCVSLLSFFTIEAINGERKVRYVTRAESSCLITLD